MPSPTKGFLVVDEVVHRAHHQESPASACGSRRSRPPVVRVGVRRALICLLRYGVMKEQASMKMGAQHRWKVPNPLVTVLETAPLPKLTDLVMQFPIWVYEIEKAARIGFPMGGSLWRR
jgi:hypothetical protein